MVSWTKADGSEAESPPTFSLSWIKSLLMIPSINSLKKNAQVLSALSWASKIQAGFAGSGSGMEQW